MLLGLSGVGGLFTQQVYCCNSTIILMCIFHLILNVGMQEAFIWPRHNFRKIGYFPSIHNQLANNLVSFAAWKWIWIILRIRCNYLFFTKYLLLYECIQVLEAMKESGSPRPAIFPLSNPTTNGAPSIPWHLLIWFLSGLWHVKYVCWFDLVQGVAI